MVQKRWFPLLAVLGPALAGCASGGGAPPAAVSWEPGNYALEATVANPGGGTGGPTTYQAELVVSATGAISMTSSTGLCQDPAVAEEGQDRERGQRTFRCGETTFRLRPGAATVIGDITAPVVVEQVVTECLRSEMNPTTGMPECVQSQKKIERTTRQVRAQVRVVRATR